MVVTISLKDKGTLDLLSKTSGASLCWTLESFDGERKAGFKLSQKNQLDNTTMDAEIEADEYKNESRKFLVNTLLNNKIITSKEVIIR